MRKLVTGFILLNSLSAFAGNLYYSNGPAKGEEVTKALTYFGINDICFVGNAKAAKTSLYFILDHDIEKSAVFSQIDKKKDALVYGYVDTNCTDDGGSEASCRSIKTAKRCR
jgi:hypothetical protein